jgi:anti-sigma B factor antagonist
LFSLGEVIMSFEDQLSVRSKRTGKVHRITPTGELDLATVPILQEAFETVFSDGGAEMIVVDLTELAFMDSTGLNALLEMYNVCEHADRLRVINGSPTVERLFDITGLRKRLPVIDKDTDPLAPLPRDGG